MRSVTLRLFGLVAIVCSNRCLWAEVLTYDNLAVSANGSATVSLNGYGGLGESNLAYLDGTQIGVGYANGVVSPNNVAYDPGGTPSELLAMTGTFSLFSAYFTAAWRDGMQITVDGYVGAQLVDSQQFIVNTTGPVFETFDFIGITEALISTSGGTIHSGYNLQDTNGEQFVMDNLNVTTPEPGALALATVGAVGVSLAARRRRAV